MSNAEVTVYSKKPCVQCDATMRKLDEFGVTYTIKDATDLENLEYISDVLGHTSAPVVTVHEDGELVQDWSGYQPEKLNLLK